MSESSENTSTSETESEDEYDETDSDDGTLIYKLSNIEDRELHDKEATEWKYTDSAELDPLSDNFDILLQNAFDNNHAPLIIKQEVTKLFPLWNVYNTVVLDGKFGKGLYATQKIPKGHMFLAECGVIGNSDSTRMEAALLAIGEFTLAHSVLKAKTPDSWCPFPEFSLDHWNTVRSSVADNAYTLGSERRVLFHLTSRINHSCSPNAFRKHYKNQIQVFATRDISPGSEIFLQYSVKAGHEDKSHFECDCKRSLPDRKLIQKESSHI